MKDLFMKIVEDTKETAKNGSNKELLELMFKVKAWYIMHPEEAKDGHEFLEKTILERLELGEEKHKQELKENDDLKKFVRSMPYIKELAKKQLEAIKSGSSSENLKFYDLYSNAFKEEEKNLKKGGYLNIGISR